MEIAINWVAGDVKWHPVSARSSSVGTYINDVVKAAQTLQPCFPTKGRGRELGGQVGERHIHEKRSTYSSIPLCPQQVNTSNTGQVSF